MYNLFNVIPQSPLSKCNHHCEFTVYRCPECVFLIFLPQIYVVNI